jgi:hypothetical protein
MPCRDCRHFLSSVEANKPRWGLAGYGYCQAPTDPDLRARFFRDESACWLTLPRFQEAPHAPK